MAESRSFQCEYQVPEEGHTVSSVITWTVPSASFKTPVTLRPQGAYKPSRGHCLFQG